MPGIDVAELQKRLLAEGAVFEYGLEHQAKALEAIRRGTGFGLLVTVRHGSGAKSKISSRRRWLVHFTVGLRESDSGSSAITQPLGGQPMALRSLSSAERTFARTVYSNSIRLLDVRVQDDLGLGGRPWTSPPTILYNKYILHVGTDFYPSLVSSGGRKRLLIHELAHVWQGQHGVPLGYVLNSAAHQTISGLLNGGDVAPAYSYSTGLQWRNYNCEQQASIVEDWYALGSSTSNSRYVYITTNVRPGNPWA